MAVVAAGGTTDPQTVPAITPPMGWNSWDSYGLTVRESEVRANAEWMAAHLKQYGWEYIVVDEGWYLQNPESNGKPSWLFTISQDGRYLPAPNRFPSSQRGQGFKPLADYTHSLGLKFGIHIIRGIPREAVVKDLPLAGSSFRAAAAADRLDVCYWQSATEEGQLGQKVYWNSDNYGVAANAAGQAYYDSLAKLYASWGVDLIKVDCVANPYRAEEIRMISLAIRKTGRPIVLSLSPGPTPIGEAEEARKYAQMWRISNDILDFWMPEGLSPGIKGVFSLAARWAPYAGSGGWPDADMLPIGYLGRGANPPRRTRLTRNEQLTVLTLWSMLRSPLIMGGDLPATDEWTNSLLTNRDVIAVDQHSTNSHAAVTARDTIVWLAQADKGEHYIAAFNIGEIRRTLHYAWKDLQLSEPEYRLLSLWTHEDLGRAGDLNVTLDPHACVLYRLTVNNLRIRQ